LPSFFGVCVAPKILGMVFRIKVINNDIWYILVHTLPCSSRGKIFKNFV
jgi:hypothetical protein